MDSEFNERNEVGPVIAADRIGFARLTRMAFNGIDLTPLWQRLMEEVVDGTADAGCALDLSLIAQLLGEKETGLSIQAEALAFHQLYRSPCSAASPRLRVLALAAAIDMGGNTPIEFLLEDSGIELQTLYVIDGMELPQRLPDHDVAIVVASDSEECLGALRIIDRAAPSWPRPLLNPPHLVGNLDRDKLHQLLRGIGGLDIPATLNMTRGQLSDVARSKLSFSEVSAGDTVPGHRPPARFACRRGARQTRRSQRDRSLSRGTAGTGFFRIPLCRLRQRRSIVSQVPCCFHRGATLRMSYGDRRSLGYLVSQCGDVGQRSEASRRRRRSCARSTSDLRAGIGPHWPTWPIGSALTISRSTARKTSAESC